MPRRFALPVLPGFEPPYIRLDLTKQPDGSWCLRTWGVEAPGFVAAKDSDLYEHLAAWEAFDVVGCVLEGWLPLPPA